MGQLLDINGYSFIVNSLNYTVYPVLKSAEYIIECTPFEDKDVEFVKQWCKLCMYPFLDIPEEFKSNKYSQGVPRTTGNIEGYKPLQNLIIQSVQYDDKGKPYKIIIMGGETLND